MLYYYGNNLQGLGTKDFEDEIWKLKKKNQSIMVLTKNYWEEIVNNVRSSNVNINVGSTMLVADYLSDLIWILGQLSEEDIL